MESQELARRYGLAMTVGGLCLAWFGAGWLILAMFGWYCSLSPPVCNVSAMNYLPQILFVSVGGGLAGSGLYVWLAAARTMERRPISEQAYSAGQALLVMGGITSLGTYAFVHSILFGWNPGGLFQALEYLVFLSPPVVFILGLILLAVVALKPDVPPGHRLRAVKIRPKTR